MSFYLCINSPCTIPSGKYLPPSKKEQKKKRKKLTCVHLNVSVEMLLAGKGFFTHVAAKGFFSWKTQDTSCSHLIHSLPLPRLCPKACHPTDVWSRTNMDLKYSWWQHSVCMNKWERKRQCVCVTVYERQRGELDSPWISMSCRSQPQTERKVKGGGKQVSGYKAHGPLCACTWGQFTGWCRTQVRVLAKSRTCHLCLWKLTLVTSYTTVYIKGAEKKKRKKHTTKTEKYSVLK